MHPSRSFRWDDREAMLAFVADRAFAHLFALTPEGPRVAHVPVLAGDGTLRFHLAKSNALTAHLDGATAVASVAGPDAYVSPDWYGSADQVPTWNYVTVEAEGRVRRLDEAGLVAILDDLSAVHEAKLAKAPWTRAKMTPGRFEAMLPAIVGFEMTITALRGTRKLGQNKRGGDVDGLIAGLDAANPEMAALVAGAHGR